MSASMNFHTRLHNLWAAVTKALLATAAIAVAFLILLFATKALAQDAAAAPSVSNSIFDLVKTNFLTPSGLAGLVITIIGIAGKFAWATEKRKRIIALGVKDSFAIVEDIHNELDEGPAKDGFDKAARGLQELDKWLVAQGWRPASPQEQQVAALALQAIHGGEIAKAKVIATAAEHIAEATAAADPSVP